MSVLIQAKSLITRKITLDVSYPGGWEGWVAYQKRDGTLAHSVLADDFLVVATFLTADAIEAAAWHLMDHGLIHIDDDGQIVDIAVCEQGHGLLAPCAWLKCEPVEGSSFLHCWESGGDPGALATPDGWEADQSPMIFIDDRHRDGMLYLGQFDGPTFKGEHWLDMNTGRVQQYEVANQESRGPGPILQGVMKFLDARGVEYNLRPTFPPRLEGEFIMNRIRSRFLFEAQEDSRLLSSIAILPIVVGEEVEEEYLKRTNNADVHSVNPRTRGAVVEFCVDMGRIEDGEKAEPSFYLMGQILNRMELEVHNALYSWEDAYVQAGWSWDWPAPRDEDAQVALNQDDGRGEQVSRSRDEELRNDRAETGMDLDDRRERHTRINAEIEGE